MAFGGALLFGRIARRAGAQRAILASLVLWVVVVGAGFVLPAAAVRALPRAGRAHRGRPRRQPGAGPVPVQPTRALGREAEYFSLYQSAERGTSWSGTLLFGLVFQLTHTYRAAIVALVVFFVVGGVLLARVDVRRGSSRPGTRSRPWCEPTTRLPPHRRQAAADWSAESGLRSDHGPGPEHSPRAPRYHGVTDGRRHRV